MHQLHEQERVAALLAAGFTDAEIAAATDVNRRTISDWRRKGFPRRSSRSAWSVSDCPRCGGGELDERRYSYLLGLYLGDGSIVRARRGVHKLRITMDKSYPCIVRECAEAIEATRPPDHMRVMRASHGSGAVNVYAYWKHWPCVFPQHGPGLKHMRPIRLAPWQDTIVETFPELLLRGLIHSDGCRSRNRVNGKVYPRYLFKNASADIRQIFCRNAERCGLSWRRMDERTVSIARRVDVAWLDRYVGPKT